MSYQEPYEKEEKGRGMEEKAEEKEQEKVREKQDEKSWDEKWRRDPLSAIVWAAILIWAGVAWLAWNLNLLDSFARLGDLGPWTFVLAGAGVILLTEVLIRTLIPVYSGPVAGSFILGVIFLGISLSDLISWDLIWPLILIGFGALFLFRGLLRRR